MKTFLNPIKLFQYSNFIIRFKALLLLMVISHSTAITFDLPQGDIRTVAPFNEIEINGAYTVLLVQGDTEKVTVEADPEIISSIITKVENGKLKIYTKEKFNGSGNVALTITFKDIRKLECSGAAVIKSGIKLVLNDFDFELSGAGKSNLDITATKLNIDISGAAKAHFKGSVKRVNLDISGTGNASVHAISKLNIEISGTGNVTYKGEPQIEKSISGVGNLRKI